MPDPGSWHEQQRWFPVSNDSGEIVPSFGILDITGTSSDLLVGAKPTAFGATFPIAINGPQPIAVGGVGECTLDFPCWVAFDTGDTPANGEQYGPVSGQFTAKLRSPGFVIIGGQDGTNVLVDRAPTMQVLFENDSGTVAQDATGTASVFYFSTGTWTEEADATHNFTFRNGSDTTFNTAIRGAANWEWNSSQWIGFPITCS